MNSYPLLNFKTDSFSFRLFSNTKDEQQMIEEFMNDEKTQSFLPDFLKYIRETQQDLEQGFAPLRYTSIAYYEDKPIGLITFFDMEKELIFSHGVRPSERGKRFSSRIKKEVFDYVFSTLENIEKITVYIDVNNENNLNSLKKLVYDSIEKVYSKDGDTEFYRVSNYNPYLKKKMMEVL